ncbi:hypothetical protein FH972_023852 [Carpinus fangiana]|uniref:Uncharacterized protein n=1 Tax=Carpinus fangiana TaxID=176857 RepID=A0A5N6KX14_9ROSI|nr:hypothetical protein FH972_023852 [Carpinus fangiana]
MPSSHGTDQHEVTEGQFLATHSSTAPTSSSVGLLPNDSSNPKSDTMTPNSDKPSSAWGKARDSFPWFKEIICWTLALLLYIAIIIILKVYQGHTPPSFSGDINLNSIIALFGTVADLLLLVPIVSALGQLKWLKVDKQMSVLDFSNIDEASHGISGSFKLIKSGRGGDITDAAYTAILNTPGASHNVTPNCPTGYCAWDTMYYTWSVCNTCQNITSQLNATTMNYYDGQETASAYTLSNGFFLSRFASGNPHNYGALNVTATQPTARIGISRPTILGAPYTSVAFANQTAFLLGVLAIGPTLNGLPEVSDATSSETLSQTLPVAFECLLQLCVKGMTAAQQNGSLVETAHEIYPLNLTSADVQFSQLPTSQNQNFYQLQAPPDGGKTFQVDENLVSSLRGWLFSLIQGNATAQFVPDDVISELAPITQSLEAARILKAMNADNMGFPKMMDSLAASMSNAFRTKSAPVPGGVPGVSRFPTTLVDVRLVWLAYPFTLLALSLAVLVVIAWQTRSSGRAPWKDSTLALLFHGLDMPTKEGPTFRQTQSTRTMKLFAKKKTMQLEQDHLVIQ